MKKTIILLLGFIATFQTNLLTQPVASFTASETESCSPATVYFTNTSTGCIGTTTFLWDAGNGLTSSQENPSFAFENGGIFNVSLTVYCDGYESNQNLEINIEEVTASYTIDQNSQFSCWLPHYIDFTNTSSANAVEFIYYFQDGDSATTINPTHTYLDWGAFSPLLVAKSESGCIDTFTGPEIILGDLAIEISSDQTISYTNEEVNFSATTIPTLSNCDIHWNFGDGNSGNGPNIVHSFLEPGIYDINVTASSDFCLKLTDFPDYITIVSEPEIGITVTPATGQEIADGSVSVTVSGGVEPIAITCNSAKTEHEFTDLLPGNYTINVEDANGHTASEEFTLGWVSKVNDINTENKTSVFSTISEGTLIVQTTHKIPSSIILINTKGQIIYETIPNSERTAISINDYKDGLYFIKYVFSDNIITDKIFISNK